jgi:hypothetical protein
MISYPDGAGFNWTQTDTSIIVSFRVPVATKQENIILSLISDDSLSLSIPNSNSLTGSKSSSGNTDVSTDGDILLRGVLFDKIIKSAVTVSLHSKPLQPDQPPSYGLKPSTLIPTTPSSTQSTTQDSVAEKPYQILILRLTKAKTSPWPYVMSKGLDQPYDMDPHSIYLLGSARHDADDSSAINLLTLAAEHGSQSSMLKLAAWSVNSHRRLLYVNSSHMMNMML